MKARLLLFLPAWLALFPLPCVASAAETPGDALPAADNAIASPCATEPAGPPSPGVPEPLPTVTPPAWDNVPVDNAAVLPSSAEPGKPSVPGAPEPPPRAIPPSGDNVAGIDNTWVDRSHGFVEMCLFTAVDWCDRLLGGETLLRGSDQPKASLWWKNDFRYDGLQHYTFRTAFRAGIRLPRLANKWRVVIAGENKGDPTAAIPSDPGTPGTNEASQVRVASTALVYELFRTSRTFSNLAAGVEFPFPLDPYGRGRFGYAQPLGTDTLGRFTITGIYKAQGGPGVSNQLDFEHRLSRATQVVWANSASLSEETNGWAWGTELSLVHMPSRDSFFKIGGSVRGDTRPAFEVQNYRVYTGYRRSILRSWLFWELEPDVNWPRKSDGTRELVYGATLRLEVFFLGKETAPEPRPPPPAPPPLPPDIPTVDGRPDG